MVPSSKNVLITGGAKGLGAHLARHLCAEGHRILVLDRTAVEDLAPDYQQMLAQYMTVDLGDELAVRDCIAGMLASNEGRIDVLINNAGARSFQEFSAFDAYEIERCIQVNFKTPLLLTHALLPLMKQNGYGRIINIGSLSGFRVGGERRGCHDQCDLPRFLSYSRGGKAAGVRGDAEDQCPNRRYPLAVEDERRGHPGREPSASSRGGLSRVAQTCVSAFQAQVGAEGERGAKSPNLERFASSAPLR